MSGFYLPIRYGLGRRRSGATPAPTVAALAYDSIAQTYSVTNSASFPGATWTAKKRDGTTVAISGLPTPTLAQVNTAGLAGDEFQVIPNAVSASASNFCFVQPNHVVYVRDFTDAALEGDFLCSSEGGSHTAISPAVPDSYGFMPDTTSADFNAGSTDPGVGSGTKRYSHFLQVSTVSGVRALRQRLFAQTGLGTSAAGYISKPFTTGSANYVVECTMPDWTLLSGQKYLTVGLAGYVDSDNQNGQVLRGYVGYGATGNKNIAAGTNYGGNAISGVNVTWTGGGTDIATWAVNLSNSKVYAHFNKIPMGNGSFTMDANTSGRLQNVGIYPIGGSIAIGDPALLKLVKRDLPTRAIMYKTRTDVAPTSGDLHGHMTLTFDCPSGMTAGRYSILDANNAAVRAPVTGISVSAGVLTVTITLDTDLYAASGLKIAVADDAIPADVSVWPLGIIADYPDFTLTAYGIQPQNANGWTQGQSTATYSFNSQSPNSANVFRDLGLSAYWGVLDSGGANVPVTLLDSGNFQAKLPVSGVKWRVQLLQLTAANASPGLGYGQTGAYTADYSALAPYFDASLNTIGSNIGTYSVEAANKKIHFTVTNPYVSTQIWADFTPNAGYSGIPLNLETGITITRDADTSTAGLTDIAVADFPSGGTIRAMKWRQIERPYPPSSGANGIPLSLVGAPSVICKAASQISGHAWLPMPTNTTALFLAAEGDRIDAALAANGQTYVYVSNANEGWNGNYTSVRVSIAARGLKYGKVSGVAAANWLDYTINNDFTGTIPSGTVVNLIPTGTKFMCWISGKITAIEALQDLSPGYTITNNTVGTYDSNKYAVRAAEASLYIGMAYQHAKDTRDQAAAIQARLTGGRTVRAIFDSVDQDGGGNAATDLTYIYDEVADPTQGSGIYAYSINYYIQKDYDWNTAPAWFTSFDADGPGGAAETTFFNNLAQAFKDMGDLNKVKAANQKNALWAGEGARGCPRSKRMKFFCYEGNLGCTRLISNVPSGKQAAFDAMMIRYYQSTQHYNAWLYNLAGVESIFDEFIIFNLSQPGSRTESFGLQTATNAHSDPAKTEQSYNALLHYLATR